MSAESIKALGRDVNPKTETRREMKRQPPDDSYQLVTVIASSVKGERDGMVKWLAPGDIGQSAFRVPYVAGQVVYVKERFLIEDNRGLGEYLPPRNDGRPVKRVETDDENYWMQPHYAATDPRPTLVTENGLPWKSPLFMPQWAARYWLKIVSVKLQQLGDMTEADAVAEGIEYGGAVFNTGSYLGAYREIWNRINPKAPWRDDLWVWAITFARTGKPC